ncbi:MAG: threonine synthase [Acidimicrobiia bacterium]|nr:threonine synthase [Acidimicrobiia bacterium]
MRYVSTRGAAPDVDFEGALLTGLAPDGGLYVPERWPALPEIGAASGYAQVAAAVIAPFVEGVFSHDEILGFARDVYGDFRHESVAPLRPLAEGEMLLELFWGPTLSFKDYALQLVGKLLDQILRRRGERVTVIGATSGDTGSAAIDALRDLEAIEVVMLHPEGRVSDVQRRQMTTVASSNIHNVAVRGTFDDCQDLVKAMFSDDDLRAEVRPAAVNSINWARIMSQIVYYVWAAHEIGALDDRVTFAVPTGNFGNVFSAYGARQMGVPIDQLIVGNNANHGLSDFLTSGSLPIGEVVPTHAPAMDIQVPSNLERLLFDVFERRGEVLASLMNDYRVAGSLDVLSVQMTGVRDLFDAGYSTDDEILTVIRDLYHETGVVVDPHTATGIAAGRAGRRDRDHQIVFVATAHPAKFPEAIQSALHLEPDLPDDLDDLMDREERFEIVDNDLEEVERIVRRVAPSK